MSSDSSSADEAPLRPFSTGRPMTKSQIIMQWCQEQVSHDRYKSKGVRITNMSTSWKDGLAFCAILHSANPRNIPTWDGLSASDAEGNLTLAFQVALERYSVEPLLDPEDLIDFAKPDARSIMTYVIVLRKQIALNPGGTGGGRSIASVTKKVGTTSTTTTTTTKSAKTISGAGTKTQTVAASSSSTSSSGSKPSKLASFLSSKKAPAKSAAPAATTVAKAAPVSAAPAPAPAAAVAKPASSGKGLSNFLSSQKKKAEPPKAAAAASATATATTNSTAATASKPASSVSPAAKRRPLPQAPAPAAPTPAAPTPAAPAPAAPAAPAPAPASSVRATSPPPPPQPVGESKGNDAAALAAVTASAAAAAQRPQSLRFDDEEPTKSGFLLKMGQHRKGLKNRYFVLTSNTFRWYKKAPAPAGGAAAGGGMAGAAGAAGGAGVAAQEKPQGLIDMRDVNAVHSITDLTQPAERQYELCVVSKRRTRLFGRSAMEVNAWRDAIADALRSGGDGRTLELAKLDNLFEVSIPSATVADAANAGAGLNPGGAAGAAGAVGAGVGAAGRRGDEDDDDGDDVDEDVDEDVDGAPSGSAAAASRIKRKSMKAVEAEVHWTPLVFLVGHR